MEDRSLVIGGNTIPINFDKDNNKVTVGNFLFTCKEDFYYFVNKLTDIAEDMNEEIIL